MTTEQLSPPPTPRFVAMPETKDEHDNGDQDGWNMDAPQVGGWGRRFVCHDKPLAKVIVIAQDGDLFIDTKNQTRFQVASAVLWTASAVFKTMFGPQSLSPVGNPPVVVRLEEDHPYALQFVFMVLHHQHDRLPALACYQAAQVATICHKYGLHTALQPTADKLFKPVENNRNILGDWLLISYVFGYEEIFTRVSADLLLYGKWRPEKGFSYGRWNIQLSKYTPEIVLNELEKRRTSYIERLREHIKTIQEERSISIWGPSLPCTFGGMYKAECEALQLGQLVSSVSRFQLDSDEAWMQSIYNISQDLKSIRALYLPSGHHKACSWVPELQKVVDDVLAGIEGLKLSEFPFHRERPRRVEAADRKYAEGTPQAKPFEL